MTSFIELPRMHFDGRDQQSLYVNVADIVSLTEQWDRTTRLEIRGLGTEGTTAGVVTYVPIGALLGLLGELAGRPGVRSWTDDTKRAFGEPVAAALKEAATKERAASHAAR